MTTNNLQTSDRRTREVAELQGLYGPFQFDELLLQKLWLRGDFDPARLQTENGEPVNVLHPGTWNRLSGPDFRGARLVIGDREIHGDVELHFRVGAWTQHGHDCDPAYDNVVLHVVLFPPSGPTPAARTSQGRILPVLSLVGSLWHDLEEYAADEALAESSGVNAGPLVEELLALPDNECTRILADGARKRWTQKVHFSRVRINRLGWEEACHQTTLEILGYRSNRTPMLRIANHFPFQTWRDFPPTVDTINSLAKDWWSLRGVRPANHPRTRIDQYLKWMETIPDWPARLRVFGFPDVPNEGGSVAVGGLRKKIRLTAIKRAIARDLCSGVLGGTRFDTWVCNLVLPFRGALAAREEVGLGRIWEAWYPGDAPAGLIGASRRIRGVGSPAPDSNGLIQGLLAAQFDRETR